ASHARWWTARERTWGKPECATAATRHAGSGAARWSSMVGPLVRRGSSEMNRPEYLDDELMGSSMDPDREAYRRELKSTAQLVEALIASGRHEGYLTFEEVAR